MSTTTPTVPPKKHVQKPDDFVDAKDYEKFRRQAFVYMSEYPDDFNTDAKRIRFTISFMKGGLPEKFAANFVDSIMDQPAGARNWGTDADLETKMRAAFGDKNKKSNAENQIMLLKQGSKTAEEYFQEFGQLAYVAGYNDTHHDDILIKLARDAVHTHIIDSIYQSDTLPTDFAAWQTKIINIDNLARQRKEQKKMHAPQTFHRPTTIVKKPDTPHVKTGTGITFGGSGQRMDVDKAKAEGRCFKCGEKGHMAKYCPNKAKFQVRNITEAPEQPEQNEEDFLTAQ
jgi:hypothetical protein